MEKEEFKPLIAEDTEAISKKRSHRRLFIAFLIVDAILIAYLIYSLIFLFTHL